jgi:hypothetical protein
MSETREFTGFIDGSVHIHPDDLPWATDGPSSMRILQYRPADHLLVANMRSPAGAMSRLHRHLAPAITYTVSGTWSHRPDEMDYRPGTYEYEPMGAVHRWYNGPAVVERITISFGGTEGIDDNGESTGAGTLEGIVERYMTLCEAQGLSRPKILG